VERRKKSGKHPGLLVQVIPENFKANSGRPGAKRQRFTEQPANHNNRTDPAKSSFKYS